MQYLSEHNPEASLSELKEFLEKRVKIRQRLQEDLTKKSKRKREEEEEEEREEEREEEGGGGKEEDRIPFIYIYIIFIVSSFRDLLVSTDRELTDLRIKCQEIHSLKSSKEKSQREINRLKGIISSQEKQVSPC